MPAYKVASADFTNFELLDALAETGKPLICSTGMATEDEIRYSVEFLNSKKVQFILLHCNSTYPTPDKDVNLKYLERLKEIGQCIVGYSGHERGWVIANSSVILGAKVIEKHFTLDRDLEGNDHKVSLLPDELTAMMLDLRRIEESLGCKDARVITQGELMNREVLAKSLHASMDIEKGSVFHKDMFMVRAPGNGIQPNKLADICGKVSHRSISTGSIIYETDLIGFVSGKSEYSFTRPYGIPVRYHDYERLTKNKELDFVEFHLSYSDLSIEPLDFIQDTKNRFVTVHAPELFENDHLLDLASSNEVYRQESMKNLRRVVDHCRKIRSCFNQESVLLVLNAGGWSVDGFVEDTKKADMYNRIEESLSLIDLSGIELSIQTMPPFPWHFGGQSHHNLFVRAEEIAQFCKKTGFKICMDVSHTMMACNYHDDNLYQFMEKVSEYINYFHVVDAKGIDGEGVQIGHGDVDFSRLSVLLNKLCNNVPFIPEVWQGHTNQGEGFWKALGFLENKGL
jgi:sugar phosphate isomerase/epimerase